jgi:hypothetical protein
MLFWLPMIILGGIWAMAIDAASGQSGTGPMPATDRQLRKMPADRENTLR